MVTTPPLFVYVWDKIQSLFQLGAVLECVAHNDKLCYDKGYLPRPTKPDFTKRMENDMKEVDPQNTSRALAFELWMKAPMPMVTLMKTLDVTPLVRLSQKRGYKFNMLLCWCIGKAAAEVEDCYLLPVGDKLMQYDRLAVNTVVAVRDGGIATCDIPVSADLEQFDQVLPEAHRAGPGERREL